MTITYTYGDSLYVNITNRCSNRCDFCVRTQADGFYSDNLWLEREPTEDEILGDIVSRGLDNYKELVFCGYGEPTERLETMLNVCKRIKCSSDIKIRLNTNGQSDLINGRSTAPEFAGKIDIISVSLNAANAEEYDSVCHSEFGLDGYYAMLRFASEVKKYVADVRMSVVRGSIPDAELTECEKIAANAGVKLRVRDMIKK